MEDEEKQANDIAIIQTEEQIPETVIVDPPIHEIGIEIPLKTPNPKTPIKSANDALEVNAMEREALYIRVTENFYKESVLWASKNRIKDILEKIYTTRSTDVVIATIRPDTSDVVDFKGTPSNEDALVSVLTVTDELMKSIQYYSVYIGKATIVGRDSFDGWEFVWEGLKLSIRKRHWFWSMLLSFHKIFNNVIY